MRQPLYVIAAISGLLALAAAMALRPVAAAAQASGDGAALYAAKCGGCHSLATNRIGPAHKGVFGRKAGTVPGYRYSVPLKKAAIVWNEATLDRWLVDPQQLVRGSKMFVSIPDADQRRAIIAYLKSPMARQDPISP